MNNLAPNFNVDRQNSFDIETLPVYGLESITFSIPKNNKIGIPSGRNDLEDYARTDILPFNFISNRYKYFSDEKWDFSEDRTVSQAKSGTIFDFSKVPGPYINICKYFVLEKIISRTAKIQSIKAMFDEIRKFLCFIYDIRKCYSLEMLSSDDIEEYIEIRRNNELGKYDRKPEFSINVIKYYLKKFINFYSLYFSDINSVIPDSLMAVNIRQAKAERESHKTPDIPNEYFSKFLNTMIDIMHDEVESVFHRGMAALYVIMSQTGLRIDELLSLSVDSLKVKTVANDLKYSYILYPTSKSEHENFHYRSDRTLSNPIIEDAFDVLVNTYNDFRRDQNSNILFMGTERTFNTKSGIDNNQFDKMSKKFFREIDSSFFVTLDLNKNNYSVLQRGQVKIGDETHELYYPSNTQIRVHVYNELLRKGISQAAVERFYSHLLGMKSSVKGYYYRPAGLEEQELPQFTEERLYDFIEYGAELVGGSPERRQEIMNVIENIPDKVTKSVNEQIEYLSKMFIFRAKPFGICVRSIARKDCENDDSTDRIACMLNTCPNNFSMFCDLAVTYPAMLTNITTIKANYNRGHIREAQKGINALRGYIVRFIEPEYKSLNKILKKHPVEKLLIDHPELMDIIDSLDEIEGNISLWKTMTLQNLPK